MQEVSKPFEGVSVPAKPVKINLEETRINYHGTQALMFSGFMYADRVRIIEFL